MDIERRECAWAAGLFDGEGWTGLFEYSSRPGYYSMEMSVTQAAPEELPEVLTRMSELLGRGHLYGPFKGRGSKKVFRWRTFGIDSASATLHVLLPHLGIEKSRQAIE